jgi:hypothetical protein
LLLPQELTQFVEKARQRMKDKKSKEVDEYDGLSPDEINALEDSKRRKQWQSFSYFALKADFILHRMMISIENVLASGMYCSSILLIITAEAIFSLSLARALSMHRQMCAMHARSANVGWHICSPTRITTGDAHCRDTARYKDGPCS